MLLTSSVPTFLLLLVFRTDHQRRYFPSCHCHLLVVYELARAIKVRGANIGGWLVLEPWITPSIFERTGNEAIVDEWTFGELQDRGAAEAALRQHWDTFYTEDDFRQIAAAG